MFKIHTFALIQAIPSSWSRTFERIERDNSIRGNETSRENFWKHI